MKHTIVTALAVFLIALAGCSSKKGESDVSKKTKSSGDSASSSSSKSAMAAIAPVVTPARAPVVGEEIPDVKGPDTDGEVFSLSDYRGKVLMIDFWGDW